MKTNRGLLARLMERLSNEPRPDQSLKARASLQPHVTDTAIGVLKAVRSDIAQAGDRILNRLDRAHATIDNH